MLTDDDRKMLTEYIGECWPEYGVDADGYEAPCNKCWKWIDEHNNRTFTTLADLHAVYSRMVELEEWHQFMNYAHNQCPLEADLDLPINNGSDMADFTAWLFCLNAPDQIPERMRQVSKFIKEK